MTFEKEFPSLKDKCYIKYYDEIINERYIEECSWIHSADVKECCLDKQRVKESLNRIRDAILDPERSGLTQIANEKEDFGL